jgi:hypothetical protein
MPRLCTKVASQQTDRFEKRRRRAMQEAGPTAQVDAIEGFAATVGEAGEWN